MVLEPIYNCLHQELSNQEVLHADETSYRVLDSHKEKTYYWLYASGKSEEKKLCSTSTQIHVPLTNPKGFYNHLVVSCIRMLMQPTGS
ncbi:hypothetical protein IGJ74_000824 [Enterococcus sp. AZ009]